MELSRSLRGDKKVTVNTCDMRKDAHGCFRMGGVV